MKINVRVVIITIVAMLLIMLFFNNIFAETTTSNNIAGNKTNITEDSDSSESTDNSDIKNIGKNYPGKNYIVGNVRNDNLIDVSDAVDVLVIVANIYSWDFANSEAQDDYEIYQKLVEDGKISYNENIKSIEKVKINMRVLHNVKNPDTSVEMFGKKMKAPIFAAPVSGTTLNMGGKYTEKEMKELITKKGGLVSLLGTSDARDVDAMIEKGDKEAKLVYDAMIYQVAKAIGAYSVILKGKVDAIILTGGIARDEYVVEGLKDYVSYLGKIVVIPGEKEMDALANGALRVLRGEEEALEYTGIPVWQAK